MNYSPEGPFFEDPDPDKIFPNLDWNLPDDEKGPTLGAETDSDGEVNVVIEPEYEITGIPVVDASRQDGVERDKILRELEKAKRDKQEAIENGMYDYRTDCYNSKFFEKYKVENFNPERDHGKLAVVFVDLNKLKIVNDDPALGYAVGDNMLKETAKFLKSKFRAEDIVVRIGGDEFIVICRNDSGDEDFENNLRTRADEIISHSPVSVAYGITVYDKYRDNSPDLDDSEKGFEHTKNLAGFEMHKHKEEIMGTTERT
jgi:diguanylate cyclase (GGDEF)-like protein